MSNVATLLSSPAPEATSSWPPILVAIYALVSALALIGITAIIAEAAWRAGHTKNDDHRKASLTVLRILLRRNDDDRKCDS
jgi:hypothetical protein